jgi:hypothetical protein
MAVEAGCDAVLICGGDYEKQAAAIEGIVHAAEADPRLALRIETSRKRHEDAKARFAAGPASRPADAQALAQVLGTMGHRMIADEMARFA